MSHDITCRVCRRLSECRSHDPCRRQAKPQYKWWTLDDRHQCYDFVKNGDIHDIPTKDSGDRILRYIASANPRTIVLSTNLSSRPLAREIAVYQYDMSEGSLWCGIYAEICASQIVTKTGRLTCFTTPCYALKVETTVPVTRNQINFEMQHSNLGHLLDQMGIQIYKHFEVCQKFKSDLQRC